MPPRHPTQLRPIKIKPHVVNTALGSCEISCGDTRVLCTASWEAGNPDWKKAQGGGWVTAEYGMLPGSSPERIRREATRGKQSGRTQEIQRLIGRSLRTVVDLEALGDNSIIVDCDVLQADGGTRTAAITGGFIALVLALAKLRAKKILPALPIRDYVAAVSVGVVAGMVCLDLDYEKDSQAQVDMNVVMTGQGSFVEIQGTAERSPFSQQQLAAMLRLAKQGIKTLIHQQKKIVGRYLHP